jgi:PRTRC genetic system protein A
MLFPNLVTYHVYDGRCLPPFDARVYQYILTGDSIFVRAETPFFSAIVPVVACSIRGLAPLQPRFRLKAARIPEELLRAALTDARSARRSGGGLNEALYQFLHHGNRVQLRRPVQRATGVTVMAACNGEANILCELHSHGNMRAFWSRADDADEQGARLYAVIGRLDTAPEIRVRVGVYGYWHPLPVMAVFTGAGGFTDLYREENESCLSTQPSM